MYDIVDMHCDTMYEIHEGRVRGEQIQLRRNQLHMDLERMKQAGYLCQSFAIYSNLNQLKSRGIRPYEYGMALCDTWEQEIKANDDLIRQVRSWQDIMENQRAGRMSALMTVEEGEIYEGSVEKLHAFYDRGVRKSTLVWNFENSLGYPNQKRWVEDIEDTITVTDAAPEHGLKETGIELVREMERIGILIDLSHLNDAGIQDVFRYTKGPVLASHSNARGVAYHARNLTDEMIRQIADRGGVIGINYFWSFLAQRAIWPYPQKEKHHLFDAETGAVEAGGFASRIEDMLRHIRHIQKVGGIDCIGLGSDFDGIGGTLELNGAGEVPKLAEQLETAGFTEPEVRKIMGENVLRVYREVLH